MFVSFSLTLGLLGLKAYPKIAPILSDLSFIIKPGFPKTEDKVFWTSVFLLMKGSSSSKKDDDFLTGFLLRALSAADDVPYLLGVPYYYYYTDDIIF